MRTAILVVSAFIASSCGLLLPYRYDPSHEPEFQAKAFKEMNDRPIGKKMDSLIAKIAAAPSIFPEDIENRTLIIETYNYKEFLEVQTNKLHRPVDTKRRRKNFNEYQNVAANGKLIRDPRFKVVYVNKGEYDNLDKEEYRYVLKTTNRLHYEPEELVFQSDGGVYAWSQSILYYIVDRQTNVVFGGIDDLKQLSKRGVKTANVSNKVHVP